MQWLWMAALWFEWILLSCVRGTDWRRPDPKSINHHTSSACLHKEKNTNIINHISPFMYMGYLCSKSNITKLHTMCTGSCWESAGTFLILVSEQTAYPLFFLISVSWVLLPMFLFIGICRYWDHNSLHESPNVKQMLQERMAHLTIVTPSTFE